MAQEGKYYDLFKFNKKIIDIGSSLLSMKRLPQYFRMKEIRENNINIKTLRNSERCYICGLGPSLRDVDFSTIDGDIIAVNRFYKFVEENDLNIIPTFYCLIDDAFYKEEAIEDAMKAFKKFKGSSFVLNGKYINNIRPYTKNVKNDFYVFMWGKQVQEETVLDFTKLVPVANNVMNTAILLAMYAGYKEIYLLGADFNSFASPRRNHCYKDEIESREFSLGFELFCYSFVAEDHRQINLYAKRNGIKIFNATEESLIDAYEKKLTSEK